MEAILQADSAKRKADVQAWQETVVACEHTRLLQQDPVAGYAARSSLAQCQRCDKTDNLWLCMACGFVACGRRQFDGSGGNGHASEHGRAAGHPVALKLGTIAPEGTADVFCYECDELRLDPQLREHLALFGIQVDASLAKTEKSMAELQLEQNREYDFSMAADDGTRFEPAADRTGLVNLGNSCYLASVMQVCCALPAYRAAFADPAHFAACARDPWSCFACQMAKLQGALAPGAAQSVAPWMFKAVVSSGHPEFASAQQQDAAEFFAHLLKVIQRNDVRSPALAPFAFKQQQCLRCSCGAQRFQSQDSALLQLELAPCVLESEDPLDPHVTLARCLQKQFEPVSVELACASCGAASMVKESYLTQLPDVLVLPLSRYVTENWVPKKLDLAVAVPLSIDLAEHLRAPQHNSSPAATMPAAPSVDELTLQQLVSMGFSQRRSTQALLETGNVSADVAMNWLFEHMDDPEPQDTHAEGSQEAGQAGQEVSQESIDLLVAAGFSEAASRRALLATNLDVERAFDHVLAHPEAPEESSSAPPAGGSPPAAGDEGSTKYDLVAFIAHKGPSIHCGHYVAYVKDTATGRWLLCNDQRVVYLPAGDDAAVKEAASAAYIYYYQRQ